MKNFFNKFNKIYCINLNTRVDRWNKCIKQFESIGIMEIVERFSAKVGHNGKTKYQKGAIGCALSHYHIIQNAKKNGWDNVLVFEDDICFSKNFNEQKLNGVLEDFPKSWDLFYLGFLPHGKFYPKTNNIIHIESHGDCTHAIAYNSCVYDMILKKYKYLEKASKIHISIDGYLSRDIQKRGNSYSTNPPIVFQINDRSDISDEDYRSKMQDATVNEYNQIALKYGCEQIVV